MPQFKVQLSTADDGTVVESRISVHSDTTSDEVSISSTENGIVAGDAEERDTWGGKLDFLLSCIGYAVGLGNVWRFPYLCYENGGGAFLIPYSIFALLCAVPLFFLEISFGQFASLSPITIWRISPLFRGLGYAMVMTTLLVTLYYNIIVAYAFFFIFLSFSDPLPWTRCDHDFNTKKCILADGESNRTAMVDGVSASEEYWIYYVLQKSSSIGTPGEMRWPIVGALLLAWTIVFLCLFKGIKASGKVVYVTALFPYVILIILLIKGLTMEGATKGIMFYLTPRVEKLLEFSTWKAAANQIFYSMGAAWGVLLTMSSFNKFSNNVFRDTCQVPLINCMTSFFAGFVIFSILGFMATKLDKDVSEVVSSGMDLAFIVYPEAVGLLPTPQLWAVLFFIMILMLGCDSEFTMFECIISCTMDEFPQLRRHKLKVTGSMCFTAFLMGLPMCTQGGNYVLGLIDYYSASYSVMLIAVVECLVISWIYGIDRFCRDIELMTGKKPGIVWKVMWSIVTPAVTMGVLIAQIVFWQHINYSKDPDKRRLLEEQYPPWSVWLGIFIGIVSLLPFPVIAIVKIVREKDGTFMQRVHKLTQPSVKWGPARDADFRRYIMSMTRSEMLRWDASRNNVDVGRYKEMLKEKRDGKPVNALTNVDGSVILDLAEFKPNKEVPESNVALPGSRRVSEMPSNEADIEEKASPKAKSKASPKSKP